MVSRRARVIDEEAVPVLMCLWDESGRSLRRYQRAILNVLYGVLVSVLRSQIDAHVFGLC